MNLFAGANMKEKKEEETDMCKAWDDHKERGVREGRMRHLVELTIRRYQKGDTAEEVAEWSGENPELIHKIYGYLRQQTSDYDVEKICSELLA